MKLTDHELLKHYVGTNITICFQQKEETMTLTGKLVSYDSEELNIKLKESILYEIGLESIEYYEVKGFDDLKEQDCMDIIRAIHGSYDGWKFNIAREDRIILSNHSQENLLMDYEHSIMLTKMNDGFIRVDNDIDERLIKKYTTSETYTRLFLMGFAII